MQNKKQLSRLAGCVAVPTLAALLLLGCKSNKAECCAPTADTTAAPAPAVEAKPASPPVAPAPAAAAKEPAPVRPTIRIKTGVSAPLTDSSGNVWLADQGFTDGDTVERPELTIENTKDPAIYRAERYSMTSFTQKLPNGKYVVKLHFCETFEGISGPGQRVFSFNVEGKEFKDFDVWVKAGGALRAYVETVNVDVTDGKLDIAFTSNIENPEINGIEIQPGS